MLFRRLCFSISKSYSNPSFLSPFLRNPLTNYSHSNPLLASNYVTLKFGIHRANPISSRPSISTYATNSTMDESRRPEKVPLPEPDYAGRAEVFRALESSLGTTFSSEPIVPNPNPLIIVISGPSGVGKDAVINRLREVREDLHVVVTATSHGKRPGEIEGKDYYFVTKEEFLLMIEQNELLEYALVYGDYKGIPKQQTRDYMGKGCDIVLRVDIQGASTLRRILKNSAVFVFLVAESEEALVKRLIDRKTETNDPPVIRVCFSVW